MLKMLNTVFIVILSVTVLKKSFSKIQYFAIILVLGSLTIIAMADVYGELQYEEATDKSMIEVGIICTVIA